MCGIDATALPRLAELFGHAESAFTRPHDGLGGGLYLVQRCLEKLGDPLSFQTARGEGTRVRIVVRNAIIGNLKLTGPKLAVSQDTSRKRCSGSGAGGSCVQAPW